MPAILFVSRQNFSRVKVYEVFNMINGCLGDDSWKNYREWLDIVWLF